VIHIVTTEANKRRSTVCVKQSHALHCIPIRHVSACLDRYRCRHTGSPWP